MSQLSLLKEAATVRKDMTIEQLQYARNRARQRYARIAKVAHIFGLSKELPRLQESIKDFDTRIRTHVARILQDTGEDFEKDAKRV